MQRKLGAVPLLLRRFFGWMLCLIMAATGSPANAQTRMKSQAEALAQFAWGSALRGKRKGCRILIKNGQWITKQVRLPDAPENDTALTCPEINAHDAKNTWSNLQQTHTDLVGHIVQKLSATPPAYQNPEIKSVAAPGLRRAAWVFTCSFVRLGTQQENAQDTLDNAKLLAHQHRLQSLDQSVDAWSTILNELVRLPAIPGAKIGSDCRVKTTPQSATFQSPAPTTQAAVPKNKPATKLATSSQPKPPRKAARGRAQKIPEKIWKAMKGKSWHSQLSCPRYEDLVLLNIPYVDFDGKTQTGQLIIARDVADDILDVFAALYKQGFKIQRMSLVYKFGGNDNRSMNANNTSAFNCRATTGGRRLSEHSYGRAIDINPVQNPYVSRRRTVPAAGRAYDSKRERSRRRQGMIRRGDPVTKAFAKIGWKWGGNWRSVKDYQHFSQSGR
jgi:D-alanyl-D-alanine carboxypeptidase